MNTANSILGHARATRYTIGLLAACGLFAVVSLRSAVADAAQPSCQGRCKEAAIGGTSHVEPATGAYNGIGTVELDGKVHQVTWVSVILSAVSGPGGTLTLTGSHHVVSKNGNIDFTTSDEVTAVPTSSPGQYEFSSYLTVVGGRGRVGSGFLEVQGQFDAVQGNVVIESSEGTLCTKP